MDKLAAATKALVEAKEDLFEKDMNLEWDMKISYIDSKAIKRTCPPKINIGSEDA